MEYTAEYIFFQSRVLTRVTAITQQNSFQITDKTTNSPEEQAAVSQGKLEKSPSLLLPIFNLFYMRILYNYAQGK